jgi:hypothetical protein
MTEIYHASAYFFSLDANIHFTPRIIDMIVISCKVLAQPGGIWRVQISACFGVKMVWIGSESNRLTDQHGHAGLSGHHLVVVGAGRGQDVNMGLLVTIPDQKDYLKPDTTGKAQARENMHPFQHQARG